MAATIAWYQRVGFALREQNPAAGEPTWCELGRDGLVVQFLAGETPWPDPPSLTGCLYVYPASVQATYEDLRGRVETPWGVEDRDWGTRELVLRDPNGYFITFSEPA
jgi:hypothetical protein